MYIIPENIVKKKRSLIINRSLIIPEEELGPLLSPMNATKLAGRKKNVEACILNSPAPTLSPLTVSDVLIL